MRSTCILGSIVIVALALIQGCAPGYNSVLFTTRSNLGFSYDTAPPSLEVASSRYEGVLMPTFEGGQTLPVMASFSSGAGGFRNFFWGVKSAFATGDVAFTMSYLYEDDTLAMGVPVPYEPVTLMQIPTPTPFGCKVKYIEPGKARPVRFGTDTILGIKIKWEGQTAQFPSSANIGFKRKEGAWAPISVGNNRITDPNNPNNITKKPYEADVASLLATIDTDVTAPDTSARLRYLQYFATGSAANNLARRRAVREAMLERMDPVQAQKALAEKGKTQRETNRNLIDQIADIFNKANDEKKNKILAKAQSLKLVGASVTTKNFLGQLARLEGGDTTVAENLKNLLEDAKAS
jgi:hypothetical protein